jgi:hypothetical protein
MENPENQKPKDFRDEKTAEMISNIFAYHPVKEDQQPRLDMVRGMARNFARAINSACPNSREKSLAITHVQEAMQMAVDSIKNNE